MNKESKSYTLLYTMALVMIVGSALAYTAITLKDRQQANIDADKMRQILASVRITPAADSIVESYRHYITDSYVVDASGNRLEGDNAFDVNVGAQMRLPGGERELPVYVCTLADGSEKYILPLYGSGLWGPIWGYVSLDSDAAVVYDAYFAHQGETPGLGAEIQKPAFSSQFVGKRIFLDDRFMPVTVVKAGRAPSDGRDYVDAVSGATITSKGVADMLDNCLLPYRAFLENLSRQNQTHLAMAEKISNRKVFFNPFSKDNPVLVQILGICSVLAVTVKLAPALAMGLSVIAVLAFSNVIISILRKTIPTNIRIIVQLVVVAGLVVIVSQLLQAYAYDVSKQLSVFISLIITNCILMGRLEAFAMANRPWPSFLDGVGNGIGYTIILVSVAFFRELLGSGTLFGFRVVPQALYDAGYVDNGLMILPPMALVVVACIIWVQRSFNKDLQEK